ncbi:MAG TPA: hemerythrin domain-containing protein [Kofleriaceae bacterium]|nr:hemerythrin domain-containing protein [Kofleriaceae bacterium]
MLSRGMGKVKAVKARLSGLVGVFKTLAEQHGEVTALLESAKASDEKFTELWPLVRRELLSHEQAEMRELYPLLRASEATRTLAEHHDAEASELEMQIISIDELGIGSPERRELFQRLIDAVTDHAREEETDIFPRAQDAIGKDRAQALEAPLLAAKHQIAMGI